LGSWIASSRREWTRNYPSPYTGDRTLTAIRDAALAQATGAGVETFTVVERDGTWFVRLPG
jgi:hypothetical protein